MRGKLAFAAAALVVGAGVFLSQFEFASAPPPRWPELPAADDPLVLRIAAAEPRSSGSEEKEEIRAFLALLDSIGDRAGPALLAHWLERYGGRESGFVPGAIRDDSMRPGAAWLSRHPDPVSDGVMRRILADRSIGFDVRSRVVVALCRPGNEAMVPVLVVRAIDRDENPDLVSAILLRLDRIGGPPPKRLRELLSRPEHEYATDAAAALAVTGDPEAPSLVVEGLQNRTGQNLDRMGLFARAAAAVCGDAAPVKALVDDVQPGIHEREHRLPPGLGLENMVEFTEKRVAECDQICDAIADQLAAWLEEHPEARETEFERARAAYLASDRRRREEALVDFEAVAAAPEEDLDFAAAALAVTWLDEPWRSQCLARIDRLARVVKTEIAGRDGPREILAVLADRLLPRQGGPLNTSETWPEREEPFLLWHVLRSGRGNCLGLTSLYLAVGERLGLPLHAVLAPGHVFVRWDDGETRINVETTAGGREYPDEHYLDPGPGLTVAAEDAAAGHFLVNLTVREAVGLVCVNLSNLLRTGPFRDRRGPALIHAERACELFPACGRAWLARGTSLFAKEPERAEEALSFVARAGGILPASYHVRLAVAGIQRATGHDERALALYDEAIALAPERKEAREGRIRCLLRTGRFEDALAEAEEHGFRMFAIQARIFGGLGGWREALEALGGPRERPNLWMDVIDTLLVGDAFHAPEIDAAAALLDRLGWIRSAETTPGNEDLFVTGGDALTIIEGARARYEALVERVDALRPK